MYDIIIIGGGASGMMAAIAASESDVLASSNLSLPLRDSQKVLLIEHNSELGKKLKITGGGRCNILNCEYDTSKLLINYGDSRSALYTAFSIFGVEQTVRFFKNIGIDIKVEDRKRAFPVSEKAIDVYKALEKKLIENRVEILLNTKVTSIESINKSINSITVKDLKTNNIKEYKAKKYILATGGMSHPETGSTGDGFKLLESIEVKINQPTVGLVPIRSSTKWVHSLSGKTLKDVKITLYVDKVKRLTIKKKKINLKNNNLNEVDVSNNINVLCTHFGISGPSIINNSALVRDLLTEGTVTASIDLFQSLDHKELDQYILNIFDKNKNKKLKNVLNEIYPDNILENIIINYVQRVQDSNLSKLTELNAIQKLRDDLDREVNTVSREDRKALVALLKDLHLDIDGLMSNDMSIITDGGVPVQLVDMSSMRIQSYDNLHVTGDLLDISRPSGGYSLQLCWTTGYIAGSSN